MKVIKVNGCHDCPNNTEWKESLYCKMEPSQRIAIYALKLTIHPDCPLENYVNKK